MRESYLVRIRYTRGGKRVVTRHELRVPFYLATGQLEKLSDLAIREVVRDLTAEYQRPERMEKRS